MQPSPPFYWLLARPSWCTNFWTWVGLAEIYRSSPWSKVILLYQLFVYLPHHRLLETEADVVGLQLTARACFDVRENVAFWKRMHVMSKIQKSKEPNALSIPEYFSTHPAHTSRADLLEKLVPAVWKSFCGCKLFEFFYLCRRWTQEISVIVPHFRPKIPRSTLKNSKQVWKMRRVRQIHGVPTPLCFEPFLLVLFEV